MWELNQTNKKVNSHNLSMDPWVLRKLPPHLLNQDPVMLPFQTIEVMGKQGVLEVNTLWYGGSVMNSMSHRLAKAA